MYLWMTPYSVCWETSVRHWERSYTISTEHIMDDVRRHYLHRFSWMFIFGLYCLRNPNGGDVCIFVCMWYWIGRRWSDLMCWGTCCIRVASVQTAISWWLAAACCGSIFSNRRHLSRFTHLHIHSPSLSSVRFIFLQNCFCLPLSCRRYYHPWYMLIIGNRLHQFLTIE